MVTVVLGSASQLTLRRAVSATVDLVHALKTRLSLPHAALIAVPKGTTPSLSLVQYSCLYLSLIAFP